MQPISHRIKFCILIEQSYTHSDPIGFYFYFTVYSKYRNKITYISNP